MDWTMATQTVLSGVTFMVLEALLRIPHFRQKLKGYFRVNKELDDKMLDKASHQAVSRLVGGVHHCFALPLATYCLFDQQLQRDPCGGTSPASKALCALAAGFFIHDVVFSVLHVHIDGWQYVVHAVCCCSVYTMGAVTNTLHYYGAAFIMWEWSTPFVYWRWWLYKQGKSNTVQYAVVGLGMIFSFFFCRVLWGPATTLHWHRQLGSHPSCTSLFVGQQPVRTLIFIAAFVLNCLNFVWFYKMVSLAMKVILKQSDAATVSKGHED